MTPTERSARRAAIRAAKERAARATPDEWRNEHDPAPYGDIVSGKGRKARKVVAIEPDGACGDPACCSQGSHLAISAEDRAFIIAARTDVPALADDADRYHDLVERIAAYLNNLTVVGNNPLALALVCQIKDDLRLILTPREPS